MAKLPLPKMELLLSLLLPLPLLVLLMLLWLVFKCFMSSSVKKRKFPTSMTFPSIPLLRLLTEVKLAKLTLVVEVTELVMLSLRFLAAVDE